jgi:hypothetical protein
MLGAVPMIVLATWWMNRTPPPGSEGGRGPLTAAGLFQQAVRESERGDRAATERHLRMALGLITTRGAAPRDLQWELRVRWSLAAMVAPRDGDEAREIAAPACRLGPGGGPPEGLVAAGLCDR